MEITVADQRMLVFPSQLTKNEAQDKAFGKKVSAFDALAKVGSFLSRPKDEDFELVYSEYRYQPFWHVSAKAKYVYERAATYQVKTGSPVVTSVNYENKTYDVTGGHIHISVTEHCVQVEQDEVFVDGVTGKNMPELKAYVSLSPKQVSGELNKLIEKDAIIVPPQTRVSAIMRDALAKMIKGIQADTILEEHVEVSSVDLYYRPVFAFQYLWKSKNKKAIVEVDGITGNVTTGNRTFHEYVGHILDQNFLFDLGADAAGMLIPGGSIAVKVAKKFIDTRKTKQAA